MTCQIEDISEMFHFLLGDDQEENFFCSVRGLQGSANFDVLQMKERISSAVIIEQIYSKYPRLKRPSRRLNGTSDHMNPSSYLRPLAPGACDPRTINLEECWAIGAEFVRTVCTKDGVFTDDEVDFAKIAHDEPDTTMYKPRGEYVGISGQDM